MMEKEKVFDFIKGSMAALLTAVTVANLIGFSYFAILLFIARDNDIAVTAIYGWLFVAAIASLVAVFIGIFAIAFIGLPFVVASTRLRYSGRNYYIWSGAFIALFATATGVILEKKLSLSGPIYILRILQEDICIFSAPVIGAISALVFWKVARPDKWPR